MMYRGHLAAGAVMAPTAVGIACILSKGNIQTAEAVQIGVLAGISSFATSLLPDLDSSTSKASKKIPIVSLLRLCILIFLLSRFYIVFQDGVRQLMDIRYLMNLFSQVAIAGFLMSALSHRKLLHSIWPLLAVAAVTSSYIGFNDVITAGITTGFIMGIVSHLWGDMHTTEGCILFYPLPLVFRLARFKSGKDDLIIFVIICVECFAAISGTILFVRGNGGSV